MLEQVLRVGDVGAAAENVDLLPDARLEPPDQHAREADHVDRGRQVGPECAPLWDEGGHQIAAGDLQHPCEDHGQQHRHVRIARAAQSASVDDGRHVEQLEDGQVDQQPRLIGTVTIYLCVNW